MKTIVPIVILAASVAAIPAVKAAPFLAVGDGAEIFLTGTAVAKADSNIFMAPDTTSNTDDVVFEFKPGVELVFGKKSAVQGTWSVQENLSSYSDHKDLNSQLFSTNFAANYTDGKSKGTLTAGYAETNQNQVDDTGTAPLDYLVDRKSTNAGLTGDVAATEKTAVAVGVQYAKTDYSRTGFYDSEVATVPVNVYYEVTPKVDLGLGYRYRKSWLQGSAPDSNDNFFSVAARGDFTPKLSGQLNVGYTQRSYTHVKDANLLGVDSSFSYVASPKTTLQFGVSNDFDTNSQGQQQKNFAIRTSASTKLSEQWSANFGVNYRSINYFQLTTPRTDDYVDAQVGATYIVNAYAQISAGYNYRNNRSDLASAKFDDNVISITANLRY